jgi:hypothetical protein
MYTFFIFLLAFLSSPVEICPRQSCPTLKVGSGACMGRLIIGGKDLSSSAMLLLSFWLGIDM